MTNAATLHQPIGDVHVGQCMTLANYILFINLLAQTFDQIGLFCITI